MKKYAIITTNLFNIIMNLNNCQFEMFLGLRVPSSQKRIGEDESERTACSRSRDKEYNASRRRTTDMQRHDQDRNPMHICIQRKLDQVRPPQELDAAAAPVHLRHQCKNPVHS
jgi:hypothetical protein